MRLFEHRRRHHHSNKNKNKKMFFFICVSLVLANNVLHISDLHLDTLSDPRHYGPDVFCRSPDNQPDEETMKRTAKYMLEDFGHKIASKSHRQVVGGPMPTPAPTHNFHNKKYGWFDCDTTPTMLDSILSQALSVASSYDMIIITGDFVAHNQVNESTTRDSFSQAYNHVMNANTNSLPVIATLGNNDFYPDYNGLAKCYDEQLYHQWELWQGTWIDSSSDDTFKKFGGMRYLMYNDTLRIISINTVLYSQRNDRFKHDNDPCGQFQWLDDQLSSAESNSQRVWIVGHIPPEFDFWHDIHESSFLDIVSKHIDVIDASFFGHTHDDSFFVSKSINGFFGFIQSSITPNPPNPGVRVFNFDSSGSSFAVTNYQQYYVDLRQANANNKLSLAPLYRFNSQYSQSSPSYSAYTSLANSIYNNQTMYSIWNANRMVRYDYETFDHKCGIYNIEDEFWACRESTM